MTKTQQFSLGIVASLIVLSVAQFASAQQSGSTIADLQCAPEKGACMYGTKCDPKGPDTPENKGILQKPCKDPRGVNGHCIAYNLCKADTATGTDGKSMGVGDLSSLMQALGSLMKSLGQGGGGGGGGSPTGSPIGSQGCTSYYQVSTPSSDPCAYYVPSGGSTNINLSGGTNTNLGGSGIGDIGGSGAGDSSNPITNIISDLLGGNSDSNTNTNANANGSSGSSTAAGVGISSSTAQGASNLGPTGPGGANGEIRVLPNGATIIISNQNNSGNSVTAGFLGTQSSFNNQPAGIVASWCRTRPWASNFLSFIIPATFFDSLCTLRGFQVGESVQTGGQAQIGSSGNNVIIHNPDTTTGTTSFVWGEVPSGPPIEANIWAVPPTVPLGGRTTIYWNSKNATTCTETSPDGSFSQNTLSGGGATVPLSGPTTFTISCMGADGSHTTADVLVRLSL